MKLLAMETSTLQGSVALIIDGQVVAEESSLRQKSHSEILNVFVDHCLEKAGLQLSDMDAFAVGHGPGSFTGIRIAANAGKTYSYCYNKPLITIDSLSLLAHPARQPGRSVLAIINAYKNMVYTGLFDENGNLVKGLEAVSVRDLDAYIDRQALVVGDGWDAFHAYFPDTLLSKLSRDESFSDHPHARTLGMMAEDKLRKGQTLDWKSFTPLYIRASEAEETKKGILIKPLK